MSISGSTDGGSSAVSTAGQSPASSVATNVFCPLGMTVRCLGRLADETPGGRQALAGITTGQWRNSVLSRRNHDMNKLKMSLCEQLQAEGDAGIGIATWFVSFWTWDMFLDFLEALEDFFASEPQGLDTVIWLSKLSNFYIVGDDFAGLSRLFTLAIQSAGNLVMILGSWDKPTVLTRAWCIHELYICWNSGLRIEFALPQAQRAQLIDDMRSEPTRFSEFLAGVRSESSSCYDAKERDEIYAWVQSSVGFAGLDTIVRCTLQSWMVRLLQCKIDEASAAGKEDETADYLNALGMLHSC
jgi:hypothetical protein